MPEKNKIENKENNDDEQIKNEEGNGGRKMTNWNKQNILSFKVKGNFRKELVGFLLERGMTQNQLMILGIDWDVFERLAEAKGGFFR
jgi:hypothetical protein